MATLYAPDVGQKPLHMDAHGNAWVERYTATLTAAAADKIIFGQIPAGVEVHSVKSINVATAATVTLDVGFEPVDTDLGPTAVTDYWLDGVDIAAAGSDATTTALPILFEYPVNLVAIVNTAGYTSKRIDIIVEGKVVGPK